MQVPFPLVHSFEDVQGNFESLQALAVLGVKQGQQAITWAASAAAAATITHGLGYVPAWFSLTLLLTGQVAYLQATSVTSASIVVNGQAAAAWSGSGMIYWAAF